MNEASHPFRFFGLLRRRADDERLSEPADVGTAFGLELSMLPDDEAAPTSGTGSPGGTGWWRRLLGHTGD